ncbi:antibiotic biosynthesis monooxygenase [Humibacillus xanthopallidus]|uniref:Antibiotic biosynthesis monooxygenase n=1 Tax=Humibacillus xanthopallidus TaxID=412689 RepID=A0A543PMV5_9MICO|nr:antibiotic biosynthesis monooxygenase [Humibacillus xanthopallidus]TQN45425.1 antibiotic biosynthesis monooxygenase [Humibacillus xanthopallidus]
MHARSTTVMGQPGMMETGISHARDVVMPKVRAMDGCIGMSVLADRATGRCIVTTAWRDEDAMTATAGAVMTMRAEAAAMMGGEATVDEWEVAYLHRDHRAADGACARVTWIESDPASVDRVIDAFKMGIMPHVEQLEGFCSASLFVDRASGRGCLTATYDSEQAMAVTRDAAMGLRADLAQDTGMRVTEVGEFSLEVAHLDVPELV